MIDALGLGLFGLSATGLLLLACQLVSLRRHLRERPLPSGGALRALLPAAGSGGGALPGISILKPLCGRDDDLFANLERFAALDYPNYEVVLGVRDAADAAYRVAREAEARFAGRVRLVLQRGEPGLNPKVNQLITLAAAARHDILVVSDSNVTVDLDYLSSIAAAFADPEVGLVTHPVCGRGERRLGSLLDNLHMSSTIGPGMVSVKRVCGQDVVVGKSMALRRADLEALGGFAAVRDLLAEDYVLGRWISQRLKKRVVVANTAACNVSRDHSVRDFYHRYRRWAVIHRKAVGNGVYMVGPLCNPFFLALLGALFRPGPWAVTALFACAGIRAILDGATGRRLRGERFGGRKLLAVPLKDVLLAAAWIYGLLHDTVEWRSNRLQVLEGTRLARPPLDEAPLAEGAVP